MSADEITTLPDLLRTSAKRFDRRTAVSSREGLRTKSLTYSALQEAAESVASHLRRQGLRAGDRIIVFAPSGARTVAVLFGLFRAGLVAVPLDANSTPAFVDAVRRKTAAAAMVAGSGFPVPDRLRVIPIESLPFDEAPSDDLPPPRPNDVAEIVFTSGTTGDPKGVMLSHRNIVSDVIASSRVVPEGEAMHLLSILPLSHMFEQAVGLYLVLLKGGSVHYVHSHQPAAIVGEMRRRRVTGMVVVPRFLELLLRAVENQMEQKGVGWLWRLQNRVAGLPMDARRLVFLQLHRALGGKLRFFLCGGAALAPGLMRAWERTGVRIIEGYGATECSPVVASNTFGDRVPGSIGWPLRGVQVRLSDDGELQVRGPNVFQGYWSDPARTAAAFTGDGWYRTDDLGDADADGRLRILGRLSDRIVLASGMNVYPADVESALSAQPGVLECVVVGAPDGERGERVHAVIRPSAAADREQLARSVEAANVALASHQRIAGFSLWQGEFPRTPMQKIKRGELRKSVAGQAPSRPEGPSDGVGQAGRILRQVVRRPPPAIGPDTRLDVDLGLDSLGRVELAAVIERETGRDVSEEAIAALVTAGDLAALLSGPSQKTTPAHFPEWSRRTVARLLRAALQPSLLFLPHRLFARPFTVAGRDYLVGLDGPCLVVANHASHVDTLAILRALPPGLRRRTVVAAAADYFFARRWSAWLAALVLNAFPFSREGRVRDSIEQCGVLADAGWSILIYPEGTRSPDGRLLPFKAGIGLLATGLGVPILPVSVIGGAQMLAKGSRLPKRAAVSVRFGRPFTLPPGTLPEDATARVRAAVSRGLPRDMLPAGETSTGDG